MSVINVTSVHIKNNLSKPTNPINIEVTFESLENLKNDVEWTVVYCCSSSKDQEGSTGLGNDKYFQDIQLDCIALGPITRGTLAFEFEAPPPDFTNLNRRALFDMHALLLIGKYNDEEFIRVGWYVRNYLTESLKSDAKDNGELNDDILFDDSIPLDLNNVVRHILEDDARVTRFPISWDDVSGQELKNEGEKADGEAIDEGTTNEVKPTLFQTIIADEKAECKENEVVAQGNPTELGAAPDNDDKGSTHKIIVFADQNTQQENVSTQFKTALFQ